jgi:adenylosuccinate lyase
MSAGSGLDQQRYQSPFSWRYGSEQMRLLWGEARKRRLWRRIWVALAEAQQAAGLVSEEQVADLRAHEDQLDLERARQIEAEIQHDLMSEVRTFAEQCPKGGGVIHLGATSMDISDNADVLRLREALTLTLQRLDALMLGLVSQIERRAGTATMAFTHLQPAEPTTMGYRLAQYLQDLSWDRRLLRRTRAELRGKGLKGAVGTSASYAQLLSGSGTSPAELERSLMAALDLEPVPVATQTYPRKQDYHVLCALAGVAQSLHKLALDLRVLQSPPFGEWAEPFGARQVGSSAMPFKRNPIGAENVCSLARLLAALPRVAWDNAALSLLERTLDDSGNRRSVLPEAFLVADELLSRSLKLIAGLRVNEAASERLLSVYGVFAASERLMMEAARRGGDRQQLHERLRQHAMQAWEAVQRGEPNPLADLLCGDALITALVPAEEARGLLDPRDHLGDAEQRARALAAAVRAELDHTESQ